MREPTYLVLLALADEPRHGYGIIATVQELSDGRTTLGAGTLYGALDRLAAEGQIEPDHDEHVDGRLRRYYRLTGNGRKAILDETLRRQAIADRAAERLAGTEGWAGAR
jgi:DNA-binding PadR family transcriptional regulator